MSLRPRYAVLLLSLMTACSSSESGPQPPADATVPAGVDGAGGGDSGLVIDGVAPLVVSARGGDPVTLTGQGFVAPVRVKVAGVEATILVDQPHQVVFETPRLTAGDAELRVGQAGADPTISAGALTVTALLLAYETATDDLVPIADCPTVRAAVAFDANHDGAPDVVVACNDGLRILINQAGSLTLEGAVNEETDLFEPERPLGAGEIRALATADLDGDGVVELIVCTAAGRDLVLAGSPGGLKLAFETPWRAGTCMAVTPLGPGEVALLLQSDGPPGLYVLKHHDGTATLDGVQPAEAVMPVGSAHSTDPGVALAFDRAPGVAAGGGAAARLSFALTDKGPEAVFSLPAAINAQPDRVVLEAQAVPGAELVLRAQLVDSQGATVETNAQPVPQGAWTTLELPGPWTSAAGADAPITLPFTELRLVLMAANAPPASGQLWIDAVRVENDGQMPSLIDDFERLAPLHELTGATGLAAAELDGDGHPDVIALPGGGKPAVFLSSSSAEEGRWTASPLAADGPGPFPAAAIVDADGDGHDDIVLISSSGQDRLLIGDGLGMFVDTTAESMPLDFVQGAAVVSADVNLDGSPDLFVGNRGTSDRLYRGLGDGRFADFTPELGLDSLETAAVILVDLDQDGDDDVISVPVSGELPLHVRFALEVTP